jgi:hypothetical protein
MKPAPSNLSCLLSDRALSDFSPCSFLSLPATALWLSTKKDCDSASGLNPAEAQYSCRGGPPWPPQNQVRSIASYPE